MKTKAITLALIALFALSTLSLSAAEQAGKGPKNNNHANIIGKLNQREVRIGKRIEKLEGCLAKHPDAPDAIKNDVNKLCGDLTTQKGNIGALIGDLQKKDKEAAKADRQVCKAEHEIIKSDRAQLRADRQAWRGTRQAAGGAQHHGNKQK